MSLAESSLQPHAADSETAPTKPLGITYARHADLRAPTRGRERRSGAAFCAVKMAAAVEGM